MCVCDKEHDDRSLRFSQLRLTVDVYKSSYLVLVVGQTADLSHRQRGIRGKRQPVDHCNEETCFYLSARDFEHPCRQILSLTDLFIHCSCQAVLGQLYQSSYSCKKAKTATTTLISVCANSGVDPRTLYCDSVSLLTGVAVVLSVTLQLEVFVPHAQFFPAGDPDAEPLQHQQTLRKKISAKKRKHIYTI